MAGKKIEVQIVGDSRSVERAFGRAGNSASGFAGKMAKNAAKIAVVAATALAGLSGFAVKSAIDFESSFAGVRKTVNATEGEFKKLEKGFLDLSKRLPVNVNELNKIGEAAGQLGIKKKSIIGFTETIAKLGVTTNLSTDEAATSLARFANITRLPQREIGRLGSTVVALGNNMATTEREIVAFGLRIAGAGKQVGLTEPQILALGAALSSVGIEAEAGGTAISTAMVAIDKAVANGGEKLEGFAKTAGMSAREFAEKWRKEPDAALLAFIEGLDRVKREGGNVFQVLDKLGLGGIRVRDALLRASGAGDLLRKSLGLGEKAWKENIALNKEAEQRFKTTASQLQLLRNNVSAYAIVLGAKLLPAFNGAILAAGAFVRKFSEAKGFEAKLNVVWTGIQEAGRTITEQIGRAVAMVDWAAVWSKATGIAAGMQRRFESIDWTQIGNAIGLGIAGAVAVSGPAAQKLADSLASMARSVDWESVGRAMGPGLAQAVATAIKTALDPGFWVRNWDLALAIGSVAFGGPLGRLGSKLVAPLVRLGSKLVMNILTGIEQFSPRLAALLLNVLLKLPGIASAALSKLLAPVKAVFNKLGGLAKFTIKVLGIQAAINAVVDFAESAIEKVKEALVWVRDKAPGQFVAAAQSIGRGLATGIVVGMFGLAGRLAAVLISQIQDAIDRALRFFGVKSPSKYTEQKIGVPLGQGVGRGLQASLKSAGVALNAGLVAATRAGIAKVNELQRQLDGIARRRESEDRAAAVRAAEVQLAEARKSGKGIADAERALARAREDIVTAGWQRQLDRESTLLERRRSMIQKQLDRVQAAVERAQSKASAIFDRLSSKIGQAFEAQTAAFMSPAGQEAAAIRARRQQEDMQRAVDDARKRLAEAQEEGNADEILRAQFELSRAEEDIRLASLEQQDVDQRRAWEQERASLRERLDDRLAIIRDKLTVEGSTWSSAMSTILGTLETFGISFAEVGGFLGEAFLQSLQSTIRGTANAARAVTKATAARRATTKAAKPLLVPGLATGGIVTRPTLAMVGERGPEAVVPLAKMRGGGDTYNFHFPNFLGDKREVAEVMRSELIRLGRRNPGTGLP